VKRINDAIKNLYSKLLEKSTRLPADCEKVLNDNRWSLYDDSNPEKMKAPEKWPSPPIVDNCNKDNLCNSPVCQISESADMLNEFADKILEDSKLFGLPMGLDLSNAESDESYCTRVIKNNNDILEISTKKADEQESFIPTDGGEISDARKVSYTGVIHPEPWTVQPPENMKFYTNPRSEWEVGNPLSSGCFIVIDGPDGSGKSTVISYLKDLFPEIVVTRDPGGTSEGLLIRNLIVDDKHKLDKFSILLLFLATRFETQTKVILPTVEEGKLVISDRWDSSTFAYQRHAEGQEDMFDHIEGFNKFIKPDVFIHLDISPEAGLERSFAKAKSLGIDTELRFEKKGVEFAEQVRDGFKLYKHHYFDDNNSITINTENKTTPFICGEILMFLTKIGVL